MKNNLSTLRSRRFAARQQEATRQIIAFQLLEFWFALPILAIEKVMTWEKVQNHQKEQNILFVDVHKSIFHSLPQKNPNNHESTEYIVFLNNEENIKIGLPIYSQPVMYRPKISDFKSLSESDFNNQNFYCITRQVICLPNCNLLLLSLEKLIKSVA